MPTLYWGPWLAKIRRGGPERHLLDVIFVDYSKVRKTGKIHSSVEPRYFLSDWSALTRTPVTSQPRQSPQR